MNAERQALACQPLAGYLQSITSRLTFAGIFGDFEHAFTWTTLKYDSKPLLAAQEPCSA